MVGKWIFSTQLTCCLSQYIYSVEMVRVRKLDFPVESTWPSEGNIEILRSISCGDHYDTFVSDSKSIH